MRRGVVIAALAVLLSAGPVSAQVPPTPSIPVSADQVGGCWFMARHNMSDKAARKRCDAPKTATVQRLHKSGRWLFTVT